MAGGEGVGVIVGSRKETELRNVWQVKESQPPFPHGLGLGSSLPTFPTVCRTRDGVYGPVQRAQERPRGGEEQTFSWGFIRPWRTFCIGSSSVDTWLVLTSWLLVLLLL